MWEARGTEQTLSAFVPPTLEALAPPVETPTVTACGKIRVELEHSGRRVNITWRAWRGGRLRRLPARAALMIRVDAIWLATQPADMRAGPDSLLARVVQTFGSCQPHHAYLFAKARGSQMKVLVNDGFGLWLVARRLHQGRFMWPMPSADGRLVLSRAQFDALVLGLPCP